METNELGLVPMKVVKHFDKYNAGEVAGFIPKRAEMLRERGLAVPHDKQAVPQRDKQQRGAMDK